METWAVVVAGGTGSRFGGPKQFAVLQGRSLIDWSLGAARQACSGVVLVVPAGADEPDGGWRADRVAPGGATRSQSVRAGLQRVPDEAGVIVVHDAARPLADLALWKAVIAAVEAGADGAIPARPVTDTIKKRGAGGILETLDRSALVAVQTPQAFSAGVLRRAHAAADEATDDAALVEGLGGTVVLVDGQEDNMKITSPSDLLVAAALVGARR